MAGNVGRGPSGVCIIVITNFRPVAVAPIYNPTAFQQRTPARSTQAKPLELAEVSASCERTNFLGVLLRSLDAVRSDLVTVPGLARRLHAGGLAAYAPLADLRPAGWLCRRCSPLTCSCRCATPPSTDATWPPLAGAEHFQQCAEFLPLRNRGLGPLAMTVLPISLAWRAPTTACAAVQSTAPLFRRR
jgi:hypothetical protein